MTRRVVVGVATVIAAAALLAGCGSSHRASTTSSGPPVSTTPASASATLLVTPAHPSPRSPISFGFTAPVTAGVHGSREIGYALTVSGSRGARCVSVREAGVPAVARGARVRVRLGPAQLGGPWCPGSYDARVVELERPHCRSGVPCPEFIREVAVVARATFTVRRG